MPETKTTARPWTRGSPLLTKNQRERLMLCALVDLVLKAQAFGAVKLERMKLTDTHVHYELSCPQKKRRARR